MTKIELQIKHTLTELPEEHKLEAEWNAKKAFVMSLLEKKDINLEQATELLSIDMEQLVKLMSEHGISKFNLPFFGLTPKDRTYLSRQSILFDKMRSELESQYLGKWVLFEDGKVLDADDDSKVLLKRVSETMGNRIVLIKKVDPDEPRPGLPEPINSPSC